MKKRPETDWEIIIEDSKNNTLLKRDLEETIKNE